MTDREYEERERAEFRRQLAAVEGFSLRERQEARDEWREAISKDPELVAERIGWILNGSYGYGSYVAAREVVDNAANTRSRLNVQAYLGQTVAALEWRCSSSMARMAWNNLTHDQKETLRQAIEV